MPSPHKCLMDKAGNGGNGGIISLIPPILHGCNCSGNGGNGRQRRVKVLNAPVGRGHRGSLPILQRLNMLKIIYLFLPGKRVNFALQYVFLTPHKKYCNACPNKT